MISIPKNRGEEIRRDLDNELSRTSSAKRWNSFADFFDTETGVMQASAKGIADRSTFDLFWPVISGWWSLMDLIDHRHAQELFACFEQAWDLATFAPDARFSSMKFHHQRRRTVRLYRGQDADGYVGLSWTTNPSIALEFARGHRGIKNPKPIVCEIVVDRRQQVWLFLTERQEDEAVLWLSPQEMTFPRVEIQRHSAPDFARTQGLSWEDAT